MNMSPDEMIAVIQAHKDGKEILQQFRDESPKPFGGSWYFDKYWKYFIKPEPKTIWVNEYAGDIYDTVYDDEQEAINGVGTGVVRTAVEYQEVIK